MAQQLGIVIIIDVEAALAAGTLEGSTYFFENAGQFGSSGQGTDRLVSAIHGTYWVDGSQATAQVLNFLATGVTSLPITLPRNYPVVLEALAASRALDGEAAATNPGILPAVVAMRTARSSSILQPSGHRTAHVLLDQLGRPVASGARLDPSAVAQLPPVITDITGEAVEKGIMFPAQYGSPDLVSGGWYWSATVSTYAESVWSYTLHILLHRLVHDSADQLVWEPVPLTCEAKLEITREPMRNGFTGGASGFLPLGVPCPPIGRGRTES